MLTGEAADWLFLTGTFPPAQVRPVLCVATCPTRTQPATHALKLLLDGSASLTRRDIRHRPVHPNWDSAATCKMKTCRHQTLSTEKHLGIMTEVLQSSSMVKRRGLPQQPANIRRSSSFAPRALAAASLGNNLQRFCCERRSKKTKNTKTGTLYLSR